METETIRGTVRRVHFANAEKPWMAGKLELEDGTEVGFSGKCAANVGDKLELSGTWGIHPKYGKQFEAATGIVRMDETPEALVHLLASDSRFKGLGPVRARAVVDAALFLSSDGDIATSLRDYAPEIATRARCPLEVVQNAAAVWNGKRSYFAALATLCEQGWSNAQAQSIIHVFGENAPTIVKGDPYLLIGKIPRFGFRTVDAVALRLGVKSTDPGRLAAGLAFCLDRIGSEGNTWTNRDALVEIAIQELRPDTLDGEDKIRAMLARLIAEGVIHVDRDPQDSEIVADARMAKAEFEVFARLLAGLQDQTRDIEEGRVRFDGPRTQAVLPTLNDGQRKAVWGFWHVRFGVISGGAGVGKTYTMRSICEIAEENGLRIELCAPTGKAARKLARSTSREARTIHKLLEPQFDTTTGAFSFLRGLGNPIDADLVIVDEVSMVDVRLMRSLLVALKPTTRLLLVGDHHQIPSVSPGAILRDLLAARQKYSNSIHILDVIVRQAGELARNTSAILQGTVANTSSPVWGIQPTEKGHEESAAALVAMLVEAVVTSPTPLEPFGRPVDYAWDVQVLTPMKKGPLGTHALNVELQKLRQRLLGNAPPEPVKEGERPKPCIGDRVIWTKNDYTLDLNNGTQAIVVGFKKGGALDLITEDGREVTIPADKRALIELAYALTIHKSQGSEWPMVILIGSSAHWIMHDRNLLYTGASRAAESLTIVGDMGGLRHFATNRKSATRQTFGSFLVHGWKPRSALDGLETLPLVEPLDE